MKLAFPRCKNNGFQILSLQNKAYLVVFVYLSRKYTHINKDQYEGIYGRNIKKLVKKIITKSKIKVQNMS